MKKISALIAAICIVILVLSLLPVHGENEIYSDVLRLHVLANSDTNEDQALKLKVRDAVLEASAPILEGCDSREDAIEKISANISLLTRAAQEAIAKEGRNDAVRIELSEEVYPTRDYEAFCFPSGAYASLRVLIGDAAGQNWWCVLFPPLCLSAATEQNAEDAMISVGLTGDQYQIITETESPTYSVRFRLLEVFEEALR